MIHQTLWTLIYIHLVHHLSGQTLQAAYDIRTKQCKIEVILESKEKDNSEGLEHIIECPAKSESPCES